MISKRSIGSYKVLKIKDRISFSDIGKMHAPDLSLDRVKVENHASKTFERLRKVAAEKLIYRTSPMVFTEVDMKGVIALRKEHATRLGFMPFIIRALTASLKEFPEMYGNSCPSLSVAMGMESEKIAPFLQNLDMLSLKEIEGLLNELGCRIRKGNLSTEKSDQKTFTILNAGSFGSLFSAPKLSLSQLGILGVHDILNRASFIEDVKGSSSMMYLTFSYDYETISGKLVAPFLTHIKEKLEDPVWITEGL